LLEKSALKRKNYHDPHSQPSNWKNIPVTNDGKEEKELDVIDQELI
jgi:hypothetical protein